MFALGFSVALALYWALVGQALLVVARNAIGVLRSWLLAPALGLAVCVLGVMVLNQAGLPVERFAWPLALVLAVISVVVLIRARPRLPGRASIPFVVAGLGFAIVAGSPFLRVGFHWTAYVNDDYLNYCLAAERFRHFGFFRQPTLAELSGRDYSQFYWFMHVMSLMRFGAEEIIAWTASLLGLPALYAFMPTQIAMAVAQILAAAGLVLHRGRWRRAAQATAILLAATPMFMFGFVYQLIAQVGGLPLMLAFVALCCRRWPRSLRWGAALSAAVPAAVAGCALAVFYPEISPFGWIAIAIFVVRDVVARRTLWPWPQFWIVFLGLVVVLLRYNLLSYYYTLSGQLTHGVFQQDLSLSKFPFFLLPSGLAALFGFHTLPGFLHEPWESVFIAVGAVLLLIAVIAALVLTWRREPVGGLLVINLLMGAMLFRRGNDFGLYKLSMYLQPALMGCLAWMAVEAALLRRASAGRQSRRFRAQKAAGRRFHFSLIPLLGIGYVILVFPVGWRYVHTSLQRRGALINELMGASQRGVHLPKLPADGGVWAMGLNNVAASKFAAARYRGTELRFLDMDYFENFFHTDSPIDEHSRLMSWYPARSEFAAGRTMWQQVHRGAVYRRAHIFGDEFMEDVIPGGVSGYLDFPDENGLFNKAPHARPDSGRLLDAVSAGDAQNLACFVNSSGGYLYFLGDAARVGLFQREFDPWFDHGGIYGLGRFLLLRVEHPSSEIYVRVLASKTNKGRGNTHWSGQGAVFGENRAPLRFVGDGSGNVYAGPIRLQWLDGAAYVAIDFGEPATPFPNRRTGLNRLYHANIPLDYRLTVAFGRDISLLAPADYAALAREAPHEVAAAHPDEVLDPNFQYSGMYEDWWVSGSAYFDLAAPAAGEQLRVQGFVPQVGARRPVRLVCRINGVNLPALTMMPGQFNWLIPVPRSADARPTRFELECPDAPRLPGEDGRPVSVRLLSADLQSAPHDYRFDNSGGLMPFAPGIDSDGWAQRNAALVIGGASVRQVVLDIDSPQWTPDAPRPILHFSSDGHPSTSVRLQPGENKVTLSLDDERPLHVLEISASTDIRMPGVDGRIRSYRLAALTLR